jgi:hypothetical protein
VKWYTIANVHLVAMKVTGKNDKDTGILHHTRPFCHRFFLPASVILILIEIRQTGGVAE